MPTVHRFEPSGLNCHGFVGSARAAVMTVASGDEIVSQTLDSRWHTLKQSNLGSYDQLESVDFRAEADRGHACNGPIAVAGALPGDCIEVELLEIRPADWGWSASGGWSSPLNDRLKVSQSPAFRMLWALADGVAISEFGDRISLAPFLGFIGLAPKDVGPLSTIPPRATGGNIDCKQLTVGSRLFLPVEVAGGMLSFGDGHAVQAHGEAGGVAIECGMALVRLRVCLHKGLGLSRPRAVTPTGDITFAFDPSVDVAWGVALNDMVAWLVEQHGIQRARAISLCSLGADLHITQVANGVCGVHCCWNRNLEIGVCAPFGERDV